MPVRVPFDKSEYDSSCKQYEELTSSKLRNSSSIILGGYGASMKVEHKALVLKYDRSHTEEEKIEKLYKGVHRVKQIILCSDGGYITLDALKWCVQENITVYLIDWRGSLIQVLTPKHPGSAKLIWQQYNATLNELSLAISIELVRQKTQAQLETLALYPRLPKQPGAIEIIERSLTKLHRVPTIEKVMSVEGTNASIYWPVFTDVPIAWQKSAAKVIPPHWLSITERESLISKGHGPRWAANPFHAALNFAYALLEGQCLQALTTIGLDASCGYLHCASRERENRNALVFDIMEPFRPVIDAKVLALISKTTFKQGDFFQVFSGEVRLNEELRRYVLATCRVPQSDIDALVMWLKATLTSQ